MSPADVDLSVHSVRLLETKSGQPQTRGFHPSADDALARWLDTRKALGIGRRRLGRGGAGQGGPLFCTLDGGPLSDDYVRGLLRRLAAKAGITKRVHPHGFRHTFAVELEAAGTPVTTISKLLGHSSVAGSARYLDHLTKRAGHRRAFCGRVAPPGGLTTWLRTRVRAPRRLSSRAYKVVITNVASFVQSNPAGQPVIITYWQEPENDSFSYDGLTGGPAFVGRPAGQCTRR